MRPAYAEHTLELVREDFDKTRKHLSPVIEDGFRALASGQFIVPVDEIADQTHVRRFDHGFEINRRQIAALLGEVAALVGPELAAAVRDTALELYGFAAQYARRRGIIIADTKFEFGVDAAGRLTLIDEVLTPDSSRFWPADSYRTGISPPSFDKQFVRDYLETLHWNKQPPGPRLPPELIERTSEKYREALARLTG